MEANLQEEFSPFVVRIPGIELIPDSSKCLFPLSRLANPKSRVLGGENVWQCGD